MRCFTQALVSFHWARFASCHMIRASRNQPESAAAAHMSYWCLWCFPAGHMGVSHDLDGGGGSADDSWMWIRKKKKKVNRHFKKPANGKKHIKMKCIKRMIIILWREKAGLCVCVNQNCLNCWVAQNVVKWTEMCHFIDYIFKLISRGNISCKYLKILKTAIIFKKSDITL